MFDSIRNFRVYFKLFESAKLPFYRIDTSIYVRICPMYVRRMFHG